MGVPLLLGTIAIVVWFGERLLPHRSTRTTPPDFSAHARTLMQQYMLAEGPFRLRVRSGSPYLGVSPAALDLRDYPGVTLIGAQADGESPMTNGAVLAAHDVLVVRGDADTVRRLAVDKNLACRSPPPRDDSGDTLLTREHGVAEVVIPPRSDMVGVPVFPGMLTSSGDLVILAVQRKGANVTKEIELAVGDTLLVRGSWDALDQRRDDYDVLVVDSPQLVRRQAAPMGLRGKKAIAVLVGMVLLLSTGTLPPAVASLLAACAMILLRVLTVEQAYHAISWTTVILIGGMIPLSTAMDESGADETMANALVQAVGDAGPYALLVGLFFLTAGLGQLISNVATALIVIPIAVSAATELGVSAQPLLMTVAVAGAASFLTPIATPANLMVMGPGGYRFGDYWKLGLPLLLLFLFVSIALVPVFWPF